MDKKKISLLKYLTKNCTDSYKVLDTKKVLSSMRKYKGDYNALKSDIEYFAKRRYIDLKYLDEENMCLTIQDNLHILEENLKVEETLRKKFITMLVVFSCFSCIMAFVGAFLALLIIRK